MTTNTTHYTNYGVSMQPHEANQDGYLEYRDGYYNLPRNEWTAAERWIYKQQQRIDEFNANDLGEFDA